MRELLDDLAMIIAAGATALAIRMVPKGHPQAGAALAAFAAAAKALG